MAIAYRSYGSATVRLGTNIVITKPSGLSVGDLMVVPIQFRDGMEAL